LSDSKGGNLEASADSLESKEQIQHENSVGSKKQRSRVPIYVVGTVILVSAVLGLFYWLYVRQFETTDDAFVDGNIIVQISPKISAYVTKIHVKENQFVKKGDLLIELDGREIENKLEQLRRN
jgi:membrane fusion protein (multidrug efflux system)